MSTGSSVILADSSEVLYKGKTSESAHKEAYFRLLGNRFHVKHAFLIF